MSCVYFYDSFILCRLFTPNCVSLIWLFIRLTYFFILFSKLEDYYELEKKYVKLSQEKEAIDAALQNKVKCERYCLIKVPFLLLKSGSLFLVGHNSMRTMRIHLGVLESVYIKTQNPVLCKQREFIFSLGLFK